MLEVGGVAASVACLWMSYVALLGTVHHDRVNMIECVLPQLRNSHDMYPVIHRACSNCQRKGTGSSCCR